MDWIYKNADVLFSGIGVFIISSILGLIIWLFRKNAQSGETIKQTQKAGDDAQQTQIGKINK